MNFFRRSTVNQCCNHIELYFTIFFCSTIYDRKSHVGFEVFSEYFFIFVILMLMRQAYFLNSTVNERKPEELKVRMIPDFKYCSA